MRRLTVDRHREEIAIQFWLGIATDDKFSRWNLEAVDRDGAVVHQDVPLRREILHLLPVGGVQVVPVVGP